MPTLRRRSTIQTPSITTSTPTSCTSRTWRGLATAYRVDSYVANHGATTSDHYPVLSRYTGLTNAVAASTGRLNLANGGDTVTLRDSGSAVKGTFTYVSSLSGTDGVSMNRTPDASTGTFVLHTSISSLASSPGKRATGAAF